MRLLQILLLSMMPCLYAAAQRATQVLDRTADAIRGGGTIHATFQVTLFEGTKEKESTAGEMWMDRDKYKMVTPQLSTWFDGNTLYSTMAGSDEAYISPSEDQGPLGTGPYHFLNIYKQGYKTSMERGTLRGEQVYVVTLRARKKATQPQVIKLDIRQKDYSIMCIRALQDGDWTRIALRGYEKNVATPAGFFTFKAEEHPGVQIVDLR